MFRNLFLFLLLLAWTSASGQRIIELSTERTSTGYEIIAVNNSYMTYTVILDFSQLINLRVSSGMPYAYSIPPGRQRVCELVLEDKNRTANLKYSYRYVPGCRNTRPDEEFNYLMPVASGHTAKFYELTHLNDRYGPGEVPEGWFGAVFTLNEGDTVFAARRGRVTEIKDDETGDSGDHLTFLRNENFVKIQHEDCTTGRYVVFKKDGIFVRPGEQVEAGDPLGIAGGENYGVGFHVRLIVSYLDPDISRTMNTPDEISYKYVRMNFVTDKTDNARLLEGEKYRSRHDEEVIMQEMSKREIKKYLKDKEEG